MKIILLLISIHVICLTKDIEGSAIRAPLDVISLDDISPEERKQLDHLHNKYGRPKRSGSGGGSGDILESLKLAIGQGIKNKIGELAKGSAAATARLSSSSSSSSSGHGYSYHPPPESYDHKSLDFWSLKKSILNTLLQAVKAIKGGVIAVKGQLIKGGGYLTAAAGKLIVTKGDAVTNLGKKIAASAVLVPYHGHPSSHAEYGPPPESHYSAPSAPEDFYHGAPSAPAPDFHDSGHQYPYHDDETPDKGPSGLLVLKKIYGDQHHHHQHYVAEDKTPPFKPIEPSGPSFGTILGKFLSASSSLDPHKPEPFGHTASGDSHSYHSHSHSEPHYEVSETKHHQEVVPSAAGYVMKGESSSDDESFMNEPSDDSPFEKEPSYLGQNFDEYVGSSSIKNPQAVKTNSIPQEQKPGTIQTAGPTKQPQGSNYAVPSESSSSSQNFVQNNFDYPSLNVQTLGTAPATSTDLKNTYDIYNLPNIGDYPSGFPSQGGLIMPQSSNGELPSSLIGQNLYYPSQAPSVIDLTKDYVPPAFDSSAENFIGQQPQLSNEVSNYYNHPSASTYNQPSASPYNHPSSLSHNRPSASIQSSQGTKQHSPPSISSHANRRPTRLTHYDSAPSSSSKHRTKSTRPKPQTYSYSTTHKRPSSSTRTRTSKHKPKQTYDVVIVKSIAYELGPNGPKRLTK